MSQVELKFADKETFKESIDAAFEAAMDGDKVEIWENGDYFLLTFHSLQAPNAQVAGNE